MRHPACGSRPRPPDPIANRAVWNAKESKVVDHVRDDHRLWLGCALAGESPSPGPAGRVADLLFSDRNNPELHRANITDDPVNRLLAAVDSAPTVVRRDGARRTAGFPCGSSRFLRHLRGLVEHPHNAAMGTVRRKSLPAAEVTRVQPVHRRGPCFSTASGAARAVRHRPVCQRK